MNNTEVKKLYKALLSKGYSTDDLGDETTFNTKMSDPNNRKELYDWVSSNGNFRIGDYDSYERRLSLGSMQPTKTTPIDQNNNVAPTPSEKAEEEKAMTNAPSVSTEEEYIRGFGAGVKQGTQQLGAGLKYAGGEALDLVSQTAKDNADALAALEQMQAEGKDVAEETKTDAKSVLLPLLGHSSPAIDVVSRLFGKKNPIANANAEVATDRTIRRALKETNGDVEAAKTLLAERANEQTTADIWKEEAAQKMNEAKPTKGFGAWVGNMVPQMAGTLAGLGLSAVTKSPVPAQVLGLGQMGALTASTAGASMKEARDAGATNGEVWATGLADAAVELATEAIPFKRYISPLVNQARIKVVKEMADAVLDGKSPARNELQELLAKANEQLGGKLFSNKNVWDYIEDVGAEGLSEFAAEALQTITPMIYAEPENYPTLWEVVNNGVEGLKGGIFMGAVLGGASNAATNKAQRDRRKQQGFVDVAEVKFSDEQNDTGIAEVLSYDPKTNQASVLFDGEIIPIDNASENIINSHRFTFDEFDRGQIDMEQAESYENGRSLETPQEKNDAYNMLEAQTQILIKNIARHGYGEDEIDQFLGNDPIAKAQEVRENDPELAQAILGYVNAKATHDGVLDAVNDKIDETIAQSNATIDSRVNKSDGLIHPATLKINDRKVYIVSGNVAKFDDGTIDTESSDESVIIKDAETGETEFVDPKLIFQLDDAIDPEQEKITTAEVITNTIADQAEKDIEGVLPFNTGDSYPILDDQGIEHNVTIVSDNGDGTVLLLMDNEQQPTTAQKDMIQQMSEAYNIGRTAAVVEAKGIMDQQSKVDESSDRVDEQAEQIPEEAQPAPRIPVDEQGEPIYEMAPIHETWSAILEMNEGNEEEAIDTASIMRDNAQAELDKAMKSPKVKGKTVSEIQAAKAEQKALIKQAQDKLNYWTDVANYRDAQIELMKRAEQRANIAKAQAASQEKGRYSEENAALGAPIDFRDYVMRSIATGGVRFIWKDSATGTRGLGSHTGLKSNEERNARIWLLNNENGLYPEEAAEQLLTSYAEELGYTPNIDTMDALSEILDVVGSYATPSSMFEAVQLRHADLEAETAAQDEADAQARVLAPIAESLGLTLDEYLAWEEMMYAETLPAFEADYEQITAIFVEAAQQEEILNQNNDERSTENADVQPSVHSEGGLSDGSQAGVGVLQGTQVDNGIADSRGAEAGQGDDAQAIDAGTNDISTTEVSERADLADFPRADKATQERFREERAKFFTSDSEYAQVLKGASTVEDALVEFWRRAERAKQRDDKNGVERYESFASVLAKRVKYTEAEDNTLGDRGSIEAGQGSNESNVGEGVADVPSADVSGAEEVDSQGNPINPDGSLKLEKVESIDDMTDEDFENPYRNIELPTLPENVADAIGSKGKSVVIKKNIFERNIIRHSDLTPDQSRDILKSALYSPNLYGQNQKKRKPYNWVVVSTKDANGQNKLVLLEISDRKNNIEIVHWHYVDARGLEKLKRQAEREDGQLLILPSEFSEEVGALSDPTLSMPSESKDTITEQQKQEIEQEKIQPERISLNGYLSRLGLSSPISDYMDDKLRNPRGLTNNQRKQLERDAANAAEAYQQKRSEAIHDYAKLVSEGAIIPTSNIDTLISQANGHYDNESTKAARRALKKRGYDWTTGGKIADTASLTEEVAPTLIKGAKWDSTGEPTKMKFKRKGDNYDGYITVGKTKYGRTTSEGQEFDILLEDYGTLESAWNAFEQGEVFISPNLASIIKTLLIEKEKNSKDNRPKVNNNQEGIRFRGGELPEEEQIIADAKANGTYLIAPNGNPTNLKPKQWVQVRTKAFKEWFGDWEKATRIEKLRTSKDATITGNEIEASDDLKQYKKNAQLYGRTLQGEYTNADTGAVISLQRGRHNGGINEVLQHNYKDVAHLQSVAAIPQIIENGIYIESQANKDIDTNPNVAEYQMFVCGLNIGGEDYTVLAKVAVDNNGNRYYDHNLVSVEKGKLIDIANNEQSAISSGFGTTPDTKSTTNSQRKYKELISLLQTNSSKIVDANGEPKVVYHRTPNEFTIFDTEKIGSATDWGAFGMGLYFSPNSEQYGLYGKNEMALFLNARNPLMLDNSNAYDMKEPFFKDGSWDKEASEDFTKWVKDNGYDAVVYKTDLNEEVVVFEPNQIKSATDNMGAFDANNKDIRFRFIGERGATNLDKAEEATIRLDNLAIAREMEDAGKDAKSIKMATGWERGADSKWRYEVGDIELKYSPDRIINGLRNGEEYRLEQVLTDDSMEQLAAEYPEFMNIKLSYDGNKQDAAGYWSVSDLRIALTPATKSAKLQETIIHELQHAIQDAEGFARGIAPQYFISKDLSAYKGEMEDVVYYGDADVAYELYSIRENAERLVSEGKYKYLRNAIKSIVKTYSTNEWLSLRMYNYLEVDSNTPTKDIASYIANIVTDGSLEQWRELPYDMRNSKAGAMGKYMRVSGEVEARNVETRMGMAEDERRVSLAKDTEDVSRKDQIFIEDALGEANAQLRISDYGQQFADLQAEYDALDKNDAEALNEWRERKKIVILSFMQSATNELRLPVKDFRVISNEAEMRDFYEEFVNFTKEDVIYDEFVKAVMKSEAFYVAGMEVIGCHTDGFPNSELNAYYRLFHEQTHSVIGKLFAQDQLDAIWDEALKNDKPKNTEGILREYDPYERGEEYLAYTSQRYVHPKIRGVLEAYLKGEVSIDSLLGSAKKSLPLRNQALAEILKYYKDEYKGEQNTLENTEVYERRRGESRGDQRSISQKRGGERSETQGTRNSGGRQGLRGRVLKAATTLAESLGVKLNIIENVNDITDPNARQQRAKRGAKAWYDVTTGQVYFVLPNATSVEDAVQTVLHEVVAHKGLRDVVGREHFEEFLGKVFRAADTDTRRKIVALAAQNGWDFNVATEEYLASLAEEGFDSRENRAFLQKVRDLFMDMLRAAKIALGFNINDNDLRYMLWRTYQMQRSNGIMAVAEDVVMQQKLGVGNFRSRSMPEEEQIVADAKANGTYLIAPNGNPTNLKPKQWVQVRTKAFKAWFGDWENDPTNASKVIDTNGEPKVVYNGSKVQHYNYDGRLRTKGQSATNSKVSFFTDNKAVAERYGKFVNEVFLNIRNPYEIDYNGAGWQGWSGAADGKQRASTDSYADLLANGAVDSTLERIIENYGRAEADYLASGSVRNEGVAPDGVIAYEVADPMRSTLYIVRNAEAKDISRNSVTPKGVETFTNLGKSSLLFDSQIKSATGNMGTFDPSNDDIRYRVAPSTPADNEVQGVRKSFDKMVKTEAYQMKEAAYDRYQSIKEFMRMGSKAHGVELPENDVKNIASYENPYIAMINKSSVNEKEIKAWERKFYIPILDATKKIYNASKDKIDSLKGVFGAESIDDIFNNYLQGKHGLERNRDMAIKASLDNMVKETLITKKEAEQMLEQVNEELKNDIITPTQADARRQQIGNMLSTKKYTKEQVEYQTEVWEQRKKAIKEDASLDTWRKKQEALDKAATTEFGVDLAERDYSGLGEVFPNKDGKLGQSIASAYDAVEAFENAFDTKELWNAINAATDSTLAIAFQSSVINKETYDKIRSMYDYYIPLRGFEADTTEDVYGYLNNEPKAFSMPVKRANGRASKAEFAIPHILQMAHSAILQGNNNRVKLAFANFAQHYPTDLVKQNNMWIAYDEVNDQWVAKFPEGIPANASVDQVSKLVDEFNADMAQKAKDNPDKYRKVKGQMDVPYIVQKKDMDAHQIRYKRNGVDYILTVNGSPRLAYAMNGEIDRMSNKLAGDVGEAVEGFTRYLSGMYTQYNPDFMVSNFFRDASFVLSTVWVRENPKYAAKFYKNYALSNPIVMTRLFAKYENGTLDRNKPLEAAFEDFLKNGGETGYAILKDVEQTKKRVAKDINQNLRGKVMALVDRLGVVGRGVESSARFAAYLTSREAGRSISRSVYDAKEVSVNFNRKGAGAAFNDLADQTTMGKIAGNTAGLFKITHAFFNAGVQGLAGISKLVKYHPIKGSALLAAPMLLGWIIASLYDDDDEYYNLSETARRQNIIIPMGNGYVSIPLSIELRAMYGIGEMMVSLTRGREDLTQKNVAYKIAEQILQAFPINVLEGNGGFDALLPTAVSIVSEVMLNEDWQGMPIYREDRYVGDEYIPEWEMVNNYTDSRLVAASKFLSEATGGDYGERGAIEINPAVVQHIAEGLFGGPISFFNKMTATYDSAFGDKEFEWRNAPFLNRLVKDGGGNALQRTLNREYRNNEEKYEALHKQELRYNEFIQDESNSAEERAEYHQKLNELLDSDEYEKLNAFHEASKYIDKMYKTFNEEGTLDENMSLILEEKEKANAPLR